MLNILENPGDELWDFCNTLYHQRYSDAKSSNRKVDTWLWKLVYLPGLYKRSKFLRKAMHKELEGTLRELYLDTRGHGTVRKRQPCIWSSAILPGVICPHAKGSITPASSWV